MLLLRIIPSLSLADRKMIDTRELITEARLKCITQRAVSKRKPGYVAGAKPDSLISGNRLCGPHLTGIVRTWLVWEPSLVSHDIHGLRPPRGQHGDPIPFSPSPSPRLFDLRNGEFEYFGKRDSCIFYSLPRFAEDEEGGGWSRRVVGRRGDSPSKGSSTSQPMKFNVAFPPGNVVENFHENFLRPRESPFWTKFQSYFNAG